MTATTTTPAVPEIYLTGSKLARRYGAEGAFEMIRADLQSGEISVAQAEYDAAGALMEAFGLDPVRARIAARTRALAWL